MYFFKVINSYLKSPYQTYCIGWPMQFLLSLLEILPNLKILLPTVIIGIKFYCEERTNQN